MEHRGAKEEYGKYYCRWKGRYVFPEVVAMLVGFEAGVVHDGGNVKLRSCGPGSLRESLLRNPGKENGFFAVIHGDVGVFDLEKT